MDDAQGIQGFLQTGDGPFCDDCLGGSLGLASDEVKVAILSRAADFERSYSRCTSCNQMKVVTRKRLVA